ncbi:DNA-binding transcriptional LysR family regulator OS=Castellaniella defragrans OX=75697 GN=HNR28_000108 PE=3 SV=1 [Castellaniella defragrans]
MALVSRGEVDLSLGPHRAGLVGLDADPLLDLPFMAVFPSGHPLEKKRRVQWLDLKRSPFIALQGQFMDQLIMDLGDARVVEAVRPAYEVAFMSTALSMVHAGLGVTVCLPYARTLVDRMVCGCVPWSIRRPAAGFLSTVGNASA